MVLSPLTGVVGPLPNGLFLWLVNGCYTPENYITCPLKIDGWKMYSLLKWSLFRGYVSFQGCTNSLLLTISDDPPIINYWGFGRKAKISHKRRREVTSRRAPPRIKTKKGDGQDGLGREAQVTCQQITCLTGNDVERWCDPKGTMLRSLGYV